MNWKPKLNLFVFCAAHWLSLKGKTSHEIDYFWQLFPIFENLENQADPQSRMAKRSSFSFQMSAHRESMRTCEGLFCHRASLTKSKFLVLKSVRSGLRYQLWPFLAKCTEPLFLALIKTIAGNYTSNAVFRVKIKNTQFSHVFKKTPKTKRKLMVR